MGGLHERERELAAVEALLERRGRVLLVEGRSGIGKTSLVEAACARADELGHEVVRARGSELESGFAFGVVRQLFERRLAGAGRDDRAALLAGPAAAATGARLAMLRRVVALESAVPLLAVAAVAVAIGTGFGASAMYASPEMQYPMVAPGAAYYLITAAGILVSLGIIAATFSLLARITGPEVARNE